jgi:hypothetical protein
MGREVGGFLPFLYSFCFVYATPFHIMETEKIMSQCVARNTSTAQHVQNIMLHNHTSLNMSRFLIHQKYVKSPYNHTQS